MCYSSWHCVAALHFGILSFYVNLDYYLGLSQVDQGLVTPYRSHAPEMVIHEGISQSDVFCRQGFSPALLPHFVEQLNEVLPLSLSNLFDIYAVFKVV